MEPLLSDKDVLTRWPDFKDSRGRVNDKQEPEEVHKVQNRCEVLFKNFPNASEPEVRSSQEQGETLYVHVQLPHLKVDRGQYEVRIIEDLPS